MKTNLIKRLESGEVLIAWPPFPRMFELNYGRTEEGHLGEWIVNHPEAFKEVLKAFYEAGMDIGYPGNQGNNRYRLKEFGLEDKVYDLTLRQVQLAREVTPSNCYLGAAISISGVFLEPIGDITSKELYDSYVEQIKPCLEGGVDVFLCNDNQLEAVDLEIKAVREHCDLPVVANVMIFKTKRGFRGLMGDELKKIAAKFQEFGADIIGLMCGDLGNPIENAVQVVIEAREATDKPIIIKPCAGIARLVDGKNVQPYTPENVAREVPGWIDAGASIVGVCCGGTPDHVKAMNQIVQKVNKSKGFISGR